jgi:hypothetical protein
MSEDDLSSVESFGDNEEDEDDEDEVEFSDSGDENENVDVDENKNIVSHLILLFFNVIIIRHQIHKSHLNFAKMD